MTADETREHLEQLVPPAPPLDLTLVHDAAARESVARLLTTQRRPRDDED